MRDSDWPSEADAWRPPSSAVATSRPRFVGYPFALGTTFAACAVLYWRFKRAGWL